MTAMNNAARDFLRVNEYYPYSQLERHGGTVVGRPSHNLFYWMVSKQKAVDGKPSFWHCFPANAFGSRQSLIMMIQKKAYPLPPAMGEVMDCMSEWGKQQSLSWYMNVVQLVGDLIDQRREESREWIIRESIKLEVTERIHALYPSNTFQAYLLHNNWLVYFLSYWEGNDSDFFSMALGSLDHVDWLMDEMTKMCAYLATVS